MEERKRRRNDTLPHPKEELRMSGSHSEGWGILKEMETNKIYQMDCLEGLKELESNSIDLILTDPPYNVNLKYIEIEDDMDDVDYSEWCYKWLSELYRVLQEGRYAIIFTGDKKLFYVMKAIYRTPFLFHHFLKWNKPLCQRGLSGTVLFCRTELAFVLSKGKPNIKKINRRTLYADTLTYNNTSNNDKFNAVNHNARRPIGLYRQIIKGFGGTKVLDCFMGSGTTAVACKQLGVDFIGIELSKEYVDICNKRLSQKTLNSEGKFFSSQA